MAKEEYRYNMDKFTTSNKFKNKRVTKVDNRYKDKGTNTIYAIEVNTLKEINEVFSNLKNPVIFLSKSKRVLNKLSDIFDSDNWNENRIENLSGEEFDYVYLRQCNLLGLDKMELFKTK